MADAPAHIEVEGLKLHYGRVPADDGVSFRVAPGEQLTLLRPSGCGMTKTLRAIAGLEEPNVGHNRIGLTAVYSSTRLLNVQDTLRGLSIVFQCHAIWPHMR